MLYGNRFVTVIVITMMMIIIIIIITTWRVDNEFRPFRLLYERKTSYVAFVESTKCHPGVVSVVFDPNVQTRPIVVKNNRGRRRGGHVDKPIVQNPAPVVVFTSSYRIEKFVSFRFSRFCLAAPTTTTTTTPCARRSSYVFRLLYYSPTTRSCTGRVGGK